MYHPINPEMSRNKYNILAKNNFAIEKSPVETEDISLVFETSLVISGTKYPEPKTKYTFNFISFSEPEVIKLFFISISDSKPNGIYYGYDASAECIVVSFIQLEVGKRYGIYGRLRKGKVVHCIKAEELCYRTLCYEIF